MCFKTPFFVPDLSTFIDEDEDNYEDIFIIARGGEIEWSIRWSVREFHVTTLSEELDEEIRDLMKLGSDLQFITIRFLNETEIED